MTADQWVDVSSNNPYPALTSYKAAGFRHICRKVSEGTGYYWAQGGLLADQAHAFGLTVGHYHWLRPDSDPIRQADYFVSLLAGRTRPGDVLMTDFEATSGAADPGDVQRAAQLRAFNQRVRLKLPSVPLHVYTGNWYLAGKPACQAEARRWPIVMSDYSGAAVLPNPYGLSYVAWQYTDAARVAGITAPVDCNRWLTPHAADAATVHAITRPATSEEDAEMYRLFQITHGPNVGRVYAVRPGSVPIWLSPGGLASLSRLGLIADQVTKHPITQPELDAAAATIRKGM